MKKSLSVLLAASLSLAACQNIKQLVPEVANDVLSAHIEQGEVTKTALGESNNILWSEDDQIVAFMKTSYGHKYQIQPSFVGKTYANFSKISSVSGDDLSAGMKWDHNVAYYPYAEEIECVKSDVNYTLDVVIPAEQTYAGNSFGNGYFPMVAVSEDNDITFKNIIISAEAQPYIDMAQEVIAAVRNLTAVLETVQDTASADAAAAQIRTLTASMQELQARAEAMPRPSAAVEQQVRSCINVQEIQQLANSFMSSFIRIGMNNAYGSQALLDSLGPVMNSMPGQGM
jgi:hypothetical protein